MTVGAGEMATNAAPEQEADRESTYAAPEHKTDRESIYAAPEHKADRESILKYAAPEHQADRESMSEPAVCESVAGCRQLICCRQSGDALTGGKAGGKGKFVPGGKGEFVPGKFVPFVPFAAFSSSTSASPKEIYQENVSKGAGGEMPDVGAKQLGSKENAARLRPDSADEQSSASTRMMSRNCAKKMRQ